MTNAAVTADTSLAALDRLDPSARHRLAMLHPVFSPAQALPGEASLGAVADAVGLPLAAVLATAGGAIRVEAPAGGCGCSCGTGQTTH
ncbi:hypothetical protein D3877_09640 [Azospirillum cavernae]|uniref:Uncharacterized protein n=1 Tax=Azospirillum cavernae TaxID=2320860 RepID=A0A418W468_9PROT|nr:hypothetical protein [Azospirillum cavernae]RJF84744.1 hypothetical protein D3877_09640 [Azospirillum cavernae]